MADVPSSSPLRPSQPLRARMLANRAQASAGGGVSPAAGSRDADAGFADGLSTEPAEVTRSPEPPEDEPDLDDLEGLADESLSSHAADPEIHIADLQRRTMKELIVLGCTEYVSQGPIL